MPGDSRPWDRQRGESGKAYSAFRRFRDHGPLRSLVGARKIERRWSYRWRWFERAAEWDTEVYKRADEELLASIVAAARPLQNLERPYDAHAAVQRPLQPGSGRLPTRR